MKRVFLGIDLPTTIKNKIETLKKNQSLYDLPIKLVEAENSHVAIKFFGELADEQIELINDKVNEALNNFKSFDLKIEGSLAFPNFNQPKVLALKVESLNLMGLAKKLFNDLSSLDFYQPETRKYSPHITLGRFKANLTPEHKNIISKIDFLEEIMVNSIQIFESRLTSDGPIYTILKNFELK